MGQARARQCNKRALKKVGAQILSCGIVLDVLRKLYHVFRIGSCETMSASCIPACMRRTRNCRCAKIATLVY
jgi:hypothetical protein